MRVFLFRMVAVKNSIKRFDARAGLGDHGLHHERRAADFQDRGFGRNGRQVF